MARNKKNESSLRMAPALLALALCSLFVTLGIGYVWYKNQIDLLGHQIKEREQRLTDLERQNRMRRDQLSMLCSPQVLEATVKKLNLGLGPPALSQVIRLVDAPEAEQPGRPLAEQREALAVLGGRKN
jgi:capsular polysaccharide biosynthesis protein